MKPKIDVLGLVRHFGIPVGMAPIKYFGAIAVRDDQGDIRASILIGEALKQKQLNFTLAHLLGHFLLQIQPRLANSDWKSSGYKELIDPSRRYANGAGLDHVAPSDFAAEDLADRFAAALLLPRAMLLRAHEKLGDLRMVAEFFGVEVAVVERRLEDISVSEGSLIKGAGVARQGARTEAAIDVLNELAHSEASRGVPPEQLIRDVSQPKSVMPRAVAAHSYSDAAQSESGAGEADSQGKRGKRSSSGGLKGMDRIRELARRLDKFGDKSS
jgi:Zn-dependent peptidase ImmA (M78 family)